MGINSEIRLRKLGFKVKINIDFAINQFKLKETLRLPNTQVNEFDELNPTKGPLACARLNKDTIAVANEDGYVNLLRISKLENIVHWMAHENVIFDIKVGPDQTRLVTASGDSTIKIWDVCQKKEISKITPHHSTIKSVSIKDRNIIASGSRDGTIKVHDLRLKKPTTVEIRDAHRNLTLRKRMRRNSKTDPISCVTNVVFDTHYPRIFSTGANDAKLKLWDLRKLKEGGRFKRTRDGTKLLCQPFHEVHHPVKGIYCGYADLLLSSGGIYAACSDNRIYYYENFLTDDKPKTLFTGLQYDNCVKLAIMDTRYLFSGSRGGSALMWSLHKSEKYKEPIARLRNDDSDHDFYVVEADLDSFSGILFRDDGIVSKWSMMA